MNNKKTYSIGEASAITGISKRQLRNWEGKHIPEPLRITVGGRSHRRYTSTDIQMLKEIKEQMVNGLTLPAAAKIASRLIESKGVIKNDG